MNICLTNKSVDLRALLPRPVNFSLALCLFCALLVGGAFPNNINDDETDLCKSSKLALYENPSGGGEEGPG